VDWKTEKLRFDSRPFLFLCSVRRLLVNANFVPSSPFLITMMMEALSLSETLVLSRATQRNIAVDAILHSHRRENLKSYLWEIILRSVHTGLVVAIDYYPVTIRVPSPRVMRPGLEPNHSPPFSAEIRNRFSSVSSVTLHTCLCRGACSTGKLLK
jgi:hypothetical protein